MTTTALLLVLLVHIAASTHAASRESDWRMRIQACEDFMEKHGGQQERGRRPSQRCCQNLQRIHPNDRCHALQEAYGGGRYAFPDMSGESPYESQQKQTTART
ncbi:hypothetical protein GOP47_0016898 [Adiantum capillus-veneris]|uniref:Bifunctional inhibitor/plant lipid transfer protein/seed storage helical domain-containing protein n=1 Tax=Adiantum capillus-veneris TaxID=13818 RepID=A0A9D4UJG4_ADICA|nr:hypothetical protein GOP47_0016898 [Adiantum capillus-veneris]